MADEEKAARVRLLLAGYYGHQQGSADGQQTGGRPPGPPGQLAAQQGQAGSGGPPGPQAPRTLQQHQQQHAAATAASVEAACMEAKRHVAQMLRGGSLERLLHEHRATAKEIKNLESGMQQLVYENYSKFISATDTIRDMKTQLDGALPELSQLTATMDAVAARSMAVGGKLQGRQESMQELYRMQALLRQLQAVLDLPARMRAAHESGVLESAVEVYAEAAPVLKRFGGRGALRQVATQAEGVAKDIAVVLKKRLSERKDDTERCVLLLRKLGEPDATLQDRYLAGRAQRLRRILADAAAVADAMAAVAAMGPAPPGTAAARSAAAVVEATQGQVEAPEAWGFGAEGAGGGVPSLRAFVKALDERLINAVQETVMNVTRFFLPQDLPPDAALAKRRPLLALVRESFQEYFCIVRRVLADAMAVSVWRATHPPTLPEGGSGAAREHGSEGPQAAGTTSGAEGADEWGVDELAQALTTLSADLLTVSGSLPELHLRQRAGEVVDGAVRRHVRLCFTCLEARVAACVAEAHAHLGGPAARPGRQAAAPGAGGPGPEGEAPLRQGLHQATQALGKGLAAVLQGLRTYAAHARLLHSWGTQLPVMVQASLQSLFLALVAHSLAISGVHYDGSELHRALKLHALSPGAAPAAVPGAHAQAGVPHATEDPHTWPTSPSLDHLLNAMTPPTGPHSPTCTTTPAAATHPATPPAAAAPPPPSAAAVPCWSSASHVPAEAVRPGLVLLLAQLCRHMEQASVPWAARTLAGAFVGLEGQGSTPQHPAPPSSSAGEGAAAGAGAAPQPFQPAELRRCLSAACSALLAAYAELHGRQLSLMVRRSVEATAWLNHKEPRTPRPLCGLVAERVAAVEAEVAQLAEGGGSAARQGHRPSASGPSTSHRNERGFGAGLLLETGNVERNLAKIFQDKVKGFKPPTQFTQAAIVGAVVGIGLKSFVESIRLQTLGRAGLQQLQLDCQCLRLMLGSCAGAEVADNLLQEVVTAAVERSLDPTLLEPAILDRILGALPGPGEQHS